MLLYQPPFIEIGDLTIFQDDTDDKTFYYAVTRPSIAHDSEGNPLISAYAVLPETGIAGEKELIIEAGMGLDVQLKASDENLELAREAIKKEWGKKVLRFAPAPISDGKVYMILGAAGEDPKPEDWYITSAVSPSVFGDNMASLVIYSRGEQAKRLIASIDSQVVLGTVVYELNLLGVAPVYNASMYVNWEQIYHHFETYESTNLIFYKKEIHKSIDELSQTNAIEINVEKLDPEMKSYALESMLNEIKADVLKNLFQPASPPLSAAQKWEDRLTSSISRVLSSVLPGSTYQLRQVDETQFKETTVNLTERRVKKYPFYPQSLLSSLIRRSQQELKVKWIPLDEQQFRQEEVQIALAADTFKSETLKSVKLDCRVVDVNSQEIIQEVSFLSDGVENLSSKFSFNKEKDRLYGYQFKAFLYLDNLDSALPSELEIDWINASSPFIYFNPAAFFEQNDLRLDVDDRDIFNYANIIEANVDVMEDDSEIPLVSRTFIFDKEVKTPQFLSIISAKTIPLRFKVKLTYYLTGMREYVISFEDLEDLSFFLPNPFENKWKVEFISAADWEVTSKIITEIRVFDPLRADYIRDRFTFDPENSEATFHCVSSLETPIHEFEARLTVIGKEMGSILRGPWRKYNAAVLPISDKIKSERIIRATLVSAPDFEDKEVKKATITFRYEFEDDTHDISLESDPLEFEQIGDVVEFTHPFPNVTAQEYEYRLKASSESGDRYKSDWITSIREDILVAYPEDLW